MLSMQETEAMFPVLHDKAHDVQDSIDNESTAYDHISIGQLVKLALVSQAELYIIEAMGAWKNMLRVLSVIHQRSRPDG